MVQPQSFGTWLKRRRKALDLTQAELADQVGCSSAAIRKFEAEERTPSVQIANRLAEIFEIPGSERASFLKFVRGDPRVLLEDAVEPAPWRSPLTSHWPPPLTNSSRSS